MPFKDFFKKGVTKFKEYNTPEAREKRTLAAIKWNKQQVQLEKAKAEREKFKTNRIKAIDQRQDLARSKQKKMRNPFEMI